MSLAERRNGHNPTPDADPLSELAALGEVSLQLIAPIGFFIATQDETEREMLRRGEKRLSKAERHLLSALDRYLPHRDISAALHMRGEKFRVSLEAVRERVGVTQQEDPLLKTAFDIVHDYLIRNFPKSRAIAGFVPIQGKNLTVVLLFPRTITELQLGMRKPEIQELHSRTRLLSVAEEALLPRLEELEEGFPLRRTVHRLGVHPDNLALVTPSLVQRLLELGREDLARKLDPSINND